MGGRQWCMAQSGGRGIGVISNWWQSALGGVFLAGGIKTCMNRYFWRKPLRIRVAWLSPSHCLLSFIAELSSPNPGAFHTICNSSPLPAPSNDFMNEIQKGGGSALLKEARGRWRGEEETDNGDGKTDWLKNKEHTDKNIQKHERKEWREEGECKETDNRLQT